jgi:DNA-binding response OmpR family regulator
MRRLRGLLARILVVDDLAENGLTALEHLQVAPVDLIILDLDMPVMDGRSFFEELKRQADRPRVLILTASDARAAQLELGAEGALDKPFDIDAFRAEVKYLLG